MMAHFQAAPVPSLVPRDVQRTALHDLVALATECATTEARIERQLHEQAEAAAKALQKARRLLEPEHARRERDLHEKHRQRLDQIEQQHQHDLKALRRAEQNSKERIRQQAGPAEEKVRGEYKQEVWLADSVLEVEQNRARHEAKQAGDALNKDVEALDRLQHEAAELLARYGRQLAVHHDPAPGRDADRNDPDGAFAAAREQVEREIAHLRGLALPKLFVGLTPFLIILLLVAAAGGTAQLLTGQTEPQWHPIGYTAGAALLATLLLGAGLWFVSRKHLRLASEQFITAVTAARQAADLREKAIQQRERSRLSEATAKHDAEVAAIRDKHRPVLAEIVRKRDDAIQALDRQLSEQLQSIRQKRVGALQQAEQLHRDELQQHHRQCENDLTEAQQQHDQQISESRQAYEQGREALNRRLDEGLMSIQAPIAAGQATRNDAAPQWSALADGGWRPPQSFPQGVSIGRMHVDLRHIADATGEPSAPAAGNGPVRLALPQPFALPLSLAFPQQASLLIQSGHKGRDESIRLLQAVMARLLTSLPPGRARFTLFDPVGLGQNFAGFMHLADHDENLVGGRIWTESEQIEQRLADLTEHMETVIQKYLRNEFETIDDYNAQAGELAEPYRFLVIADFPSGFEGDSFRRLNSIISSGARCGVHVLMHRDTRQPLPPEFRLDELEHHSLNLVWQGKSDGATKRRSDEGLDSSAPSSLRRSVAPSLFVWKDEVFRQFPLTLDAPPEEQTLTRILDVVGREARQASRIEVPFETIAPKPEQFWSKRSDEEIEISVGRMGATRLQSLRLGKGVAQHVLIAGKTGSGKSTLLHALVTNAAMWYSPDEVELYLVDFKKGVEFKTYVTHALPHARAIAVESDREFGLSVLQRLDAELTRRGELFRKAGVQDLAAFRRLSDEGSDSSGPSSLRRSVAQPLPRVLLIIDEFQEFFTEDDKLAQDAALLLDRLVRQGRAFGVHVLLGSQTIGGSSGLSRSTLGQMAVRIALQTSEADSQMILGDNNLAARLLSRPGEAIYNDQGGLVEANSPFQVAWLPDDQREQYLQRVSERAAKQRVQTPEPSVFEGNAPADITKNRLLEKALSQRPETVPAAPRAWIGEPVAIKDPTALTFRRQSSANAIVIGQQDEAALAIMAAAMISLSAQCPSPPARQAAESAARFVIFDGAPADSPLAGAFERLARVIPHNTRIVEYRAVPESLDALAREVNRRQAEDDHAAPPVYVLVYALQRYRDLRKAEDEISFSMSEEEKKPNPGKQFAELLREGPPTGIHVIAWCDTPATLERTLDRTSLREFDHRILFQMSATDSSNLIDSPAANKLGFHRALAYSEEQGTLEKFRPYAMPAKGWLEHVRLQMSAW